MQQTQSPEEPVLSLPDFNAMAPEDQGSPLPPRPPWWRRRGAIITFILIALLILAGFLAFFLIRGRQRPITYQKQQVTQGNFSLTVSATVSSGCPQRCASNGLICANRGEQCWSQFKQV